jgi:pimeloyl-ACP methyl ester carboxylesterase
MLVKRLGGEKGPQFVLVHGIGVATRYFTRLAPLLARSGGVHAVELPGFGSAPRQSTTMSIEEHAAMLTAYVVGAGLAAPLLVGHSMGTQIVVEAALQRPELFPRIVGMGGVVDPRERSALLQGLRLAEDMLFETPPSNWAVLRDYARTGPRWYLKTVPVMLGYKTEEALPALAADTLLIRGARDPICRHDWAEDMARLIPRSRLVEVPGSAHVVMYTAPARVAGEILAHARHGTAAGMEAAR